MDPRRGRSPATPEPSRGVVTGVRSGHTHEKGGLSSEREGDPGLGSDVDAVKEAPVRGAGQLPDRDTGLQAQPARERLSRVDCHASEPRPCEGLSAGRSVVRSRFLSSGWVLCFPASASRCLHAVRVVTRRPSNVRPRTGVRRSCRRFHGRAPTVVGKRHHPQPATTPHRPWSENAHHPAAPGSPKPLNIDRGRQTHVQAVIGRATISGAGVC